MAKDLLIITCWIFFNDV